jgi:hypothetical protein
MIFMASTSRPSGFWTVSSGPPGPTRVCRRPEGKSHRLVVGGRRVGEKSVARAGKKRGGRCAHAGNERMQRARRKSPTYTPRETAQHANWETGGKERWEKSREWRQHLNSRRCVAPSSRTHPLCCSTPTASIDKCRQFAPPTSASSICVADLFPRLALHQFAPPYTPPTFAPSICAADVIYSSVSLPAPSCPRG